ncbi:phosphoinositide phospholipase C [Sarracenia purpurea var. burkii]
MVTQIFGELLYYPESGCLEEFPSPEALKNRIILSTKPPKEYLESKPLKKSENSTLTDGDSSDEEAALTAELDLDDRNDTDHNGTDNDDEDSDDCEPKSCHPGAPQYKHLIAIHAAKPKHGLREALKVGIDKVKRLSLSENELEKAAASYGTDVVRFTQKNILRVYPKGSRVTSSNFKPLIAWMHGAQLVAFNMQQKKEKSQQGQKGARVDKEASRQKPRVFTNEGMGNDDAVTVRASCEMTMIGVTVDESRSFSYGFSRRGRRRRKEKGIVDLEEVGLGSLSKKREM